MIKPNSLGYSQILQLVGDRILSGVYQEGGRIPSVRDMAVLMEVAPLTITRAYDRLLAQGVIYVQRGTGYFVSPGAQELLRRERVDLFFQDTVPEIKRTMSLLDIPLSELLDKLQD